MKFSAILHILLSLLWKSGGLSNRADKHKDFSYFHEQIPADVLSQIQGTGDEKVDEWLSVNIQSKQVDTE